MKRFFLIVLSFGLALAANAQIQAIDSAVDLADADDADAAAEALSSELTTPRGTLPWYQQAADRLILKAFERREIGDFKKSAKAAQGALKMLKKALKNLEANSRREDRSQLYWQMAVIQREFIKDEGEAIRLLKRSVKECPENPCATAALQTLAPLEGKGE